MDARKIKVTDNKISQMETLMLMALEGDFEFRRKVIDVTQTKEMTMGVQDQGNLLKIGEMIPRVMYTFDLCDDDRLFADDVNLLLNHPSDTIGDSSEVIVNNNGEFKWFGYRRTKKPQHVCVAGKADMYYELHCRKLRANGSKVYAKRIIPIDKKGNPLFAKVQGHPICDPRIEGKGFMISCSMIEDVHRSGVMLASFKDGVEVKLSVPLDDYKEIFFDREAPMAKNRKKAIIHWVCEHIRESKKGTLSVVKKHVRGVKDILIDGLLVNIQPNVHE